MPYPGLHMARYEIEGWGTETDRETEGHRETRRETESQRQRERQRNRDRETHIKTETHRGIESIGRQSGKTAIYMQWRQTPNKSTLLAS